MGSYTTPEPPKPWIETPCLFSPPLSRAAGCNIFLKLENLQPSGSFKSRGIGNMMQQSVAAASGSRSAADVHFYCSSGGNAGLACATSAAALGARATIVVPETTPPHMMAKLRALGADIVPHGAYWSMADGYMRAELLSKDPNGVHVPPFDHPDVWAGASTIVDELAQQVDRVDAIVCNVGGGGLLIGIMDGIERVYNRPKAAALPTPPPPPGVLAIETHGADSLNASVKAGELVTLPGITSIAASLGATRVAARAFEWTQRAAAEAKTAGETQPRLVSAVVSDADAVMGSVRFLDDARLFVEVACGATISVVYNGDLRRHLGKGMSDDEWAQKNVVLIVCGGSHMTLQLLQDYREKYGV